MINGKNPSLFTSLEELDLSYNHISKIENEIFKSCSNLKSLNLDGNEISNIDKNSFKGLENLENLTISCIEPLFLKQIDYNDIYNLKNLNLNLYWNHDYKLVLEWFKNLEYLEKLGINVNRDWRFYSESNELERIQTFKDLFSNPAVAFETFTCLKEFRIEIFNSEKFEMVRVEEFIKIKGLEISEIFYTIISTENRYYSSDFMYELKRFISQSIRSDSTEQLSIFDSTRLKHLKLNSFKIKKLNCYDTLESLELNGINFLSNDPFELLRELTILKALRLNFCIIKNIKHGKFYKLSSLKILEFRGNQLKTIYKGMFDELSSLEELDLSLNRLISINKGDLENLSNLKTLNLEQNKLSKLDASLFKCLTKLTNLNLKMNILESLDKDIFKSLQQLENVDLSGNKLKLVDGLFEGLSSLKELNIFQNDEIESIDMNKFIKLDKLSRLCLPSKIINDERYLKDIKCLIKTNKVDINELFLGSRLVSKNYVFK